jgi:hypothetical protein
MLGLQARITTPSKTPTYFHPSPSSLDPGIFPKASMASPSTCLLLPALGRTFHGEAEGIDGWHRTGLLGFQYSGDTFFVVPGLELRAYTLSHSTSAFCVRFFQDRSRELFAWAGFKLQS